MFKNLQSAAGIRLLTALLWLTCGSSSMAQQVILPSTFTPTSLQSPVRTTVPGSRQGFSSGGQISLNGRTSTAAWSQWQLGAASPKVRTGLSDAAIQRLGIQLLNTKEAAQQPVEWFSQSTTHPLLSTHLTSTFRFLDITELATTKLTETRFP